MFSYLLSVAIAFLFFGTINSVLVKMSPDWYLDSNLDDGLGWFLAVVFSLLWFFAIGIAVVLFLMYLLKLLTDWIAEFILNKVEKRKQSKLLKEKQDV